MATPTDRSAAGRAGEAGPSRRAARAPVVAAAACGAAIATYLALVQLGVVAHPWDPLFGPASSLRVLRSSFSQALPVPDAAIGALAYALEGALVAWGGPDRWRTHPVRTLACGAVAAALGITGVLLVVLQAAVIRAGCLLCLASAAISISIAVAVRHEVRAAAGVLRRGDAFHEHA